MGRYLSRSGVGGGVARRLMECKERIGMDL